MSPFGVPTRFTDPSGLILGAIDVGCCAGCALWVAGVADVAVPFCVGQKGNITDCLIDQFKAAYQGMGWFNQTLVLSERGICSGWRRGHSTLIACKKQNVPFWRLSIL